MKAGLSLDRSATGAAYHGIGIDVTTSPEAQLRLSAT